MPTALLISNRHPAEPGGRPEKLATRLRLMREHGWDFEILHVGQPYSRSFFPGLIRGINKGRSDDIDLIISMNNPFHLHLIGAVVKSTVRKPWIAELRDPIVIHPDRDYGGATYRLASVVEWVVVRFANRLVWLDGIQMEGKYFEQKYPRFPAEKFTKLPFMGYERRRFENIPADEREPFTITYAGSFYEDWIEPYDLLRGVSQYIDSVDGDDVPIRIEFFGDWNEDYETFVEQLGIQKYVVTHGFVDHEEVIQALKGSDLGVYIGGDDPRNQLNVPSKIWDYVGSEVPILAIVDPDFRVASFLRDHELGLVVEPTNPAGVRDAVEAVWSREYEYAPDPEVYSKFSRKEHLRECAAVMNAVTAE